MRLLLAGLLCLLCAPAFASLENDGAWAGGAWASTAWADGAWQENASGTVNVPDCTSSATTQAACESSVSGAGLVPSSVAKCSASVASGDVISMVPPPGTAVANGSTVTIFVSNGIACEASTGRRLGIGISIGIN